jgi:glutamyl-Q tRNA(Asp) synthetase
VDESRSVTLHDRIQGESRARLADLGDVVIRRRDGLFAYQLAVVLDDAWQGVTDVVRGADLLPSTPWQIELQRALGLPEPRYAHVPLLVEPDGRKLAKSRRSVALAGVDPGPQLASVLRLLRLEVPDELAGSAPAALLEWAVPRWRAQAVPRQSFLPVPG